MKEELVLPKFKCSKMRENENKLLRTLDCAVIEHPHASMANFKKTNLSIPLAVSSW